MPVARDRFSWVPVVIVVTILLAVGYLVSM